MKIVILNESYISPAQIQRLEQLGEVVQYSDTTTAAQAIERIQGADIVVADMFVCPLTKEVLSSSDTLKLLALNTTAFHLIDPVVKEKGITVCNVPGFSSDSVAEFSV